METFEVNINDLVPDSDNPNVMSKKQLASLKKSIEKYGFIKPIVINEKLEIIDGNKRYSALKSLGHEKVECVYLNDISNNTDKIIFRKAMNNHGEHNKDMDAKQFASVFDSGKSNELAEILQTSQASIMNMINKMNKGDGYNLKTKLESNTTKKSKLEFYESRKNIRYGDVIELGDHELVCLDCCDVENLKDIIKLKFHYVLTDPPYNITDKINVKALEGIRDYVVDLDNESWDRSFNLENFLFVLHNAYLVDSYDVLVDIFTSDVLLSRLKENFIENEYKTSFLAWCKTNPMPSVHKKHYQNAVELIFHASRGNPHFNYPKKGNMKNYIEHPLNIPKRLHPTQKPMDFLMNLIANSTNERDCVLDCFAGSGSVLMACERTNRICLSIEKETKYCEIICNRYKEETGKDYNIVKNLLR